MIIDAHHHLWKYNPRDYGWIDDSMSVLRQDYLPANLKALIAEADVSGTVVVQARQMLEETSWLLEQAEMHDFIKGVVGWVDLCSTDIEEQLKRFSGYPKMAGVRHVLQDEPDDDFMLRPAFLRGMEKLQDYGLSYDLLLFPKHLPNAVKLAGIFPRQRFVLDHISKPFIKAGILDPWQDDIAALAEHSNVWCKVSGMVTEADWSNWKHEDLAPYLDTVTEAFGTDRLMLGSDWPVCRLAGEYKEVMEIGKKYFEGLDDVQKRKVFSENCKLFYQLSY